MSMAGISICADDFARASSASDAGSAGDVTNSTDASVKESYGFSVQVDQYPASHPITLGPQSEEVPSVK